MTDFAIHRLRVGTGEFGLCQMPGLTGTLEADLRRVAAFAPQLVLTLVEANELTQLGVPALITDMQALGMQVHHRPIPDFGTPPCDPSWDEAWQQSRAHVSELLATGGRVLIHCRGGCGRTGMIALRLMIDAGESPDAALTRLRETRPCAIETDAQMHWAKQPE